MSPGDRPEAALVPITSEPALSRTRRFRSRSAFKMDAQAASRQSRAVNVALVAFGGGEAISFLNTFHPGLDSRPIDLALASAAGLAEVERAIALTTANR